VSVPGAGRYWFPASDDDHHENLTGLCGKSLFDVAPQYSFIEVLDLVLVRYTCAFLPTHTGRKTQEFRTNDIRRKTYGFNPTHAAPSTLVFGPRTSSDISQSTFGFGRQTLLMCSGLFPETISQLVILDHTQDPTPEQALALRLAGGSGSGRSVGIGVGYSDCIGSAAR
jgi:hypothetical protein